MAGMDMKFALNAEIVAQGHSDDQLSRSVPTMAKATNRRQRVNAAKTEWNMGSAGGPGGTFQEHWPEHLPRPPSMKKLTEEEQAASAAAAAAQSNAPKVIVFNANTHEGSSMVRVLSERGMQVVAVVRVFTSRNTKNLIKLKNVTVKVADLNNLDAVMAAAEGCQQAFLVTKYWERFESPVEEHMAQVVLDASSRVGIQRLVLATFEDTAELRLRGRKSQLVPTADGLIYPRFEGMEAINVSAKKMGIQITHMMTSYLDDADSKKSLILIRGENGKIITQPHFQEGGSKSKGGK